MPYSFCTLAPSRYQIRQVKNGYIVVDTWCVPTTQYHMSNLMVVPRKGNNSDVYPTYNGARNHAQALNERRQFNAQDSNLFA